MGPTPEPKKFSAILEVSGGKSAAFEPVGEISSNWKIVIKPSQKQSSNLTVYKVPNELDKSVAIAFCFELKQEIYVLGVEERKISFKIQAQIKPNNFSNKFLFRWAGNKGKYGSLCSVAEPSQYLYVHDKEVILNDKPDHGFKVNFLAQTKFEILKFTVQNGTLRQGLACPTRTQCRRCLCSVGPLNMDRKRLRKRKACWN